MRPVSKQQQQKTLQFVPNNVKKVYQNKSVYMLSDRMGKSKEILTRKKKMKW